MTRVERSAAWLVILGLGGCAWLGPEPYAAQVVDAQGHPLEGAAISSDHAGVLSDSQGRFQLGDARGELTVAHAGYQLAHPTGRPEAIALQPTGRPLSVVWDARWSPPAMDGVIDYLKTRGMEVQRLTDGELPDHQDVYVLPCPAWFTTAALDRYRRLADAGAKLVVLGEWGGYDGLDLTAVNAVAAMAGLRFAPATVRSYATGAPEAWLTLGNLPAGRLTAGLSQGIRLFTAGVLDLQGAAVPLLKTDDQTFRIQQWSQGSQVICGAGPARHGSLVAIADTSLWTDETSSDGTPHWRNLDNAAFAERLLTW